MSRLTSRLSGVRVDLAILVLGTLFFLPALAMSWAVVDGVFRGELVSRLPWDVGTENNLWTWCNVTLLTLAGLFHLGRGYVRWKARRPLWLGWLLTGGLLMGLSLDDAASIHERLGPLGASLGGGEGVFHFSWLVPGIAVGAVCIAILVIHAVRLRGRPAWFILAGLALFFGGAIGMEMVSGAHLSAVGTGIVYERLMHVEETLEALGAVVLFASGAADLSSPQDRLGPWLRRD